MFFVFADHELGRAVHALYSPVGEYAKYLAVMLIPTHCRPFSGQPWMFSEFRLFLLQLDVAVAVVVAVA